MTRRALRHLQSLQRAVLHKIVNKREMSKKLSADVLNFFMHTDAERKYAAKAARVRRASRGR
jgi:hypothetical protein